MGFIEIVRASTEAVSETAATDPDSLWAPFGLDLNLFVFQLLNFIVVAAILWFLILKPLTQKMAERQKIIDKSLEGAKQIEARLTQSEQDYQEKIRQAKVEAGHILERAEQAGAKLSEEMRAKARQEIEALIVQAKKNIQLEKEESLLSLRQETATLVTLALENILKEKVTDEKDKKLIKEILRDLK